MTNTPADTRDRLRELLDDRAARTGEITLSTGAKSNFYFDCKPVTLSADGAYLVGMVFLDALDRLPERPQAVGGLTHGADPIVSSMVVLSHVRDCPIEGFYVRKEAKRHGTKRRIENPPEPGTKVVIVEDVVTTGGSLLKAVREAREVGCEVIGVLALVDREEQGGAARIRQEVDIYIPLYKRSDFPRLASVAKPGRTEMTSEQPSNREGSTLSASAV